MTAMAQPSQTPQKSTVAQPIKKQEGKQTTKSGHNQKVQKKKKDNKHTTKQTSTNTKKAALKNSQAKKQNTNKPHPKSEQR